MNTDTVRIPALTQDPAPAVTDALLQSGEQAELFTLDQVAGYGALGRRERMFAEAIFAGCNQTQAAKRAGVSGDESYVRAAGAKLAAKPSVRAVMFQAWAKSGASIDVTVRQAAEIAERAFQEWQHGDTAERRAAARAEWREAAALLASIHGRLGIRVEGQIDHRFGGAVGVMPIPASVLPALAQLRREVIVARATAPGNGAESDGGRAA